MYSETLLWDYIVDNSGAISYTGQITLRDSVSNYDQLVIEVVSLDTDLSNPTWHQTSFFEIPVTEVMSSKNVNPNKYIIFSFSDRGLKAEIQGSTYNKYAGSATTNGVLKIWGIKMNDE